MASKKKRKKGLVAAVITAGVAGGAGLLAWLFSGTASADDSDDGGKKTGEWDPNQPAVVVDFKPKWDPNQPAVVVDFKPKWDPNQPAIVVDIDKPSGPKTGPDDPLFPGPDTPDKPTPTDGPKIIDVVKDYPEGGHFYQVVWGDYFGGTNGNHSIAYRLLLSEAFLAAKEFGGLDDDEARDFAKQVAASPGRRKWAIDRIQCNGVNDALYGTYGYGKKSKPSQHGRAIRLLQQHANNLGLALAGQQPIRNIALKKKSDAGSGNAFGVDKADAGHYELLWLEPVDRQLLWESGGTQLAITKDRWPDGTSKALPPPSFLALGMVDNTDSVQGRTWGCLPEEQHSYV